MVNEDWDLSKYRLLKDLERVLKEYNSLENFQMYLLEEGYNKADVLIYVEQLNTLLDGYSEYYLRYKSTFLRNYFDDCFEGENEEEIFF